MLAVRGRRKDDSSPVRRATLHVTPPPCEMFLINAQLMSLLEFNVFFLEKKKQDIFDYDLKVKEKFKNNLMDQSETLNGTDGSSDDPSGVKDMFLMSLHF